jgi:hypothetical protein
MKTPDRSRHKEQACFQFSAVLLLRIQPMVVINRHQLYTRSSLSHIPFFSSLLCSLFSSKLDLVPKNKAPTTTRVLQSSMTLDTPPVAKDVDARQPRARDHPSYISEDGRPIQRVAIAIATAVAGSNPPGSGGGPEFCR